MTWLVGAQLTRVGPFVEKKVDFHPGLNIVIGPNESGKTVLLRSVLATLTGDRSRQELRRAGGGSSGAAVRLEHDGQSWILDRDFDTNLFVASRVLDGKAVEHWRGTATLTERGPAGRAYRTLIASLFDLADPATLVILWRDWRQPSEPAETASGIRRLFAGQTPYDHQQALVALRERYHALTKVNPGGRNRTHAGRLEHLGEEIIACRRRAEAAATSFNQAVHAEAVFLASQQRCRDIREEMESLNDRLDRLADLLDLEDRRRKTAEKLALLDHEKRQLETLNQREAGLRVRREEYVAVEGLDEGRLEAVTRKRRLLATAVEREAKRRSLEAEAAGKQRWIEWAGALGLAASGVGGVLTLRFRPPFQAALTTMLFGTAGLLLGLLFHRWTTRRARRRLSARALADTVADRDQALADAAAVVLGEGLDHLDLPELSRILERQATATQLRHESAIVREEIGRLPNLEVLTEAERQLLEQAAEIDAGLASFSDFDDEVREQTDTLGELTARLASLEKADEAAQQEKTQALQERILRHTALENPAGWQRRLTLLEAEYNEIEHDSRALWLAISAVEEVQRDYLGEDLTRLTRHSQALLDELIPDHRRKVMLDRSWQPLLVGDDGPLAMERLSTALGAQLLFCSRLALVERLTGDHPAPYWFDDVVRGWDAERRLAWLGLVRRLAERHQVIVLTPDESLAAAAGDKAHVVRLA